MPIFAIDNANKMLANNTKIQPDKFENIIPIDLKYGYKEPIQRPKWAYPLAWIGYVGTVFIVPFPYL